MKNEKRKLQLEKLLKTADELKKRIAKEETTKKRIEKKKLISAMINCCFFLLEENKITREKIFEYSESYKAMKKKKHLTEGAGKT